MLLVLIICMMLRGPGSEESPIGVKVCDKLDFLLLGLILIAAIIFTSIAIINAKKEYQAKVAVGYKFVKGD